MARSLGKIYVSAGTHVAVNNIADRIDSVDRGVTERYNKGRNDDDPTPRARNLLVVRAYNMDDEVTAFKQLLRSPSDGNNAAPNSAWMGISRWQLHLSLGLSPNTFISLCSNIFIQLSGFSSYCALLPFGLSTTMTPRPFTPSTRRSLSVRT